MGQFDNFKSIAMLFTGAFLVSFGVIAFLNIEIQSRSNHGEIFTCNKDGATGCHVGNCYRSTVTNHTAITCRDFSVKIRNENLFEVLGRKISQMISTLRERNSYRRSILYHLFIQENVTRTPLRKLQYFNEDTISVDNMAENYFNQTHRHLRHVKKIKRLTQLLLKEKNNSFSRELKHDLEKKYKLNGDGFVPLFNNNRTQNANNTSRDALEDDLEVHQNCYTTNDVLEIIAITCLVNFIFWFLIIFCVNVFTRNQKMWKFDSFESLTSVGSGSDYELNQSYSKKERDFHAGNRHNLLTDYALPPEDGEGEIPENESQQVSSWSCLRPKATRNEEKINAENWIHQRFIHLSNIFFDGVSPDNLKPVKKKNFVSRNKNNKIVNSFSMEDLIF